MLQLLAPAALGAAQLITCSALPERPEGWRYRARVQYDGTQFNGMQPQRAPTPRVQTVAGVLERALSTRCSQDVRVVAAGRTDAGVHARGQTIHFDLIGPHLAQDELETRQTREFRADIAARQGSEMHETRQKARPYFI